MTTPPWLEPVRNAATPTDSFWLEKSVLTEGFQDATPLVLPPEDENNTRKVRIFTPMAEIPFAGHPNVGTAVALAQLDQLGEVVRSRPLWAAASTHPGEEQLVIKAYLALRERGLNTRLMLAPRHPNRTRGTVNVPPAVGWLPPLDRADRTPPDRPASSRPRCACPRSCRCPSPSEGCGTRHRGHDPAAWFSAPWGGGATVVWLVVAPAADMPRCPWADTGCC